MTTGKSRFVFTVAFGLALVAGAAAGVLATRFVAAPTSPTPPAAVGGALTLEDLELTPDQRDKVKRIWEGVKAQSDQSYRQAQNIQRERDAKVFDLLTDAQKAQYKQIYERYLDENTRLLAARDAAVKKAIEETKSLLSSPQREKYDAVLKSRLGREAAEPGSPSGLRQDVPVAPVSRPSAQE